MSLLLMASLSLGCLAEAPVPTPGAEEGEGAGRTVSALAEEAPGSPQLSEQTVFENVAVGTVVGTLSASGAPAPTYKLSGADASFFSLSGTQLKTAKALDYEAKPTHALTVTATNSAGSTSKSYTLYVNDVPDGPMDSWSASERYALNGTFSTWADYTLPFSLEFTADLTAQSQGLIFEKGDPSEGTAIWIQGGRLKARIGGATPDSTCELELDLSVLQGSNTYVFAFVPSSPLKIAAYVNGNKVAWRENGSHPVSANGSGGGYGVRGGSTVPTGVLDSSFTHGTLGASLLRYHDKVPSDL